ncbi:MAG: hypothetical protein ACLP8Y_06735 [Thermoplasmata archaeon]
MGDSRAAPFLALAVDSILLAGVLFATVAHSGAPVTSTSLANAVSHASVVASGADLAVDPPSYWMRSGTNVTLEAVWTSGSPLCRVTPLWYGWSLDSGNATGFLSNTSGPSSTFTADSFDSGTVRAVARAVAEVDCGANQTVIDRTNEANLSVVAPILLSGITFGPSPLLPGDSGNLDGTIVGGDPPYWLGVSWGDGTRSQLQLPRPGLFSASHQYPAGEFVPSVSAGDADSDLVNASVVETVSVGNGLEVGILPARIGAEVGVPLQFTGVAEGPSQDLTPLFDCSNATLGSAETTANATVFSCTFTSPGTAEVLFGEFPHRPGGPSASVVLYEPVVDPPTVSIEPVDSTAEAGGADPVRVGVSGGVMPISLSWNLSGNLSNGQTTLWSDGDGIISLSLPTAGDYAVGVQASDALGGTDANGTGGLRVDAPLEANAAGASILLTDGAYAEVSVDALSGCPPFSWWVVPDLPPTTGSAGAGVLAAVGQFTWNGSYTIEGNLTFTTGVADECGATWQTEFEVSLVPLLSALASVNPGPSSSNETLAVNLSIHGGLPPYRVSVNASDGESWNRTVRSDGAYEWLFATDGNGSLRVVISIADSLGEVVATNLSVVLVAPFPSTTPSPPAQPPPPSTPPGSPTNSSDPSVTDSSWIPIAVFLSAVGAVSVAVLGWRRRTRNGSREGPRPDPVATLRRIIEPADGAERFTVELLAEEAGIPIKEVRSSIDRLISERRIRSESGADGEEVLSWSSEAGS